MNEKSQVFGNIIKWKEGQRLGSGTSGEVVTAINVKTWNIFAVKKLQLVLLNMGIDKELITRLKVKLYKDE